MRIHAASRHHQNVSTNPQRIPTKKNLAQYPARKRQRKNLAHSPHYAIRASSTHCSPTPSPPHPLPQTHNAPDPRPNQHAHHSPRHPLLHHSPTLPTPPLPRINHPNHQPLHKTKYQRIHPPPFSPPPIPSPFFTPALPHPALRPPALPPPKINNPPPHHRHHHTRPNPQPHRPPKLPRQQREQIRSFYRHSPEDRQRSRGNYIPQRQHLSAETESFEKEDEEVDGEHGGEG